MIEWHLENDISGFIKERLHVIKPWMKKIQQCNNKFLPIVVLQSKLDNNE